MLIFFFVKFPFWKIYRWKFWPSTMIPQITWFLVFGLFWCKVYPRLGFSCSFDHIHNYFCISLYSSPLWYGELEKSFFFRNDFIFRTRLYLSNYLGRYFSQNTFYVLKGLYTEIFRALCSPKDIFLSFLSYFNGLWLTSHVVWFSFSCQKNFENNKKTGHPQKTSIAFF